LKPALKTILIPAIVLGFVFFLYLNFCHIQGNTVLKGISGNPAIKDESGNKIRIVFYNTENFFDTFDDPITADEEFLPDGVLNWTYGRYHDKLDKICKVIVAAGEWKPPDIIGLCEIENAYVLRDLINKTPLVKYEYRYIHQNSPDRRGIDVALLYNPSTVRVLEKEFIPVTLTSGTEKTTRDILYCMVSIQQRDTLHLFINHWPSRGGGQLETEPSRLYAAKVLNLEINSLFRIFPNPKIIAMGDFNDEPNDKSLTEGLHAQTEIVLPMPGILYNLSAGYKKKHRIGTNKFQGRWGMLDQFIVSGELLKETMGFTTYPGSFSVFAASFLLTTDDNYSGSEPFRTYKGPVYSGGFSDHLPIVLDLEWKGDEEVIK
jgi:predicted extracellular nuclease